MNTDAPAEIDTVSAFESADRASDRKGFALRLAITLALIAIVMGKLDLGDFSARFASFDPTWTVLAFLTVFAAVIVSAWKWGLILRERGHPLPYRRLVHHYFVGLFFNNVLPTTVGGDAVRAWETTRDTGEVPEAMGSVVTERLIAGVALGVTALLGLPFVETSPKLLLLVAAFLVIDLVLVGLFLVPRVAEGIVSKLLPPRFAGLRDAVTNTVQVVRSTLKNPRLFIRIMLLSILFQIFVAGVNACIFEAMGVPVTLAQCVIYTPMIFTVTMLPISLSGLGVREAAYWYFFAQVGVSQVDAVVASLAFFIIVGISSLPGAPLFVLNRRRRRASAACTAADERV
ncbi:lysylphosphatidylglycerol synthase transmembrane domain-containing protein [Pseudothauera rhizosphaerae]|uniref:Flippase-like domain-containing protein n=1 Tax=Pseudothauera rhizosphaerae TaxID=2565932 RepID=A0A4V3WBC5_9RHOO|nr:lysylphosphatidylglycerol synthase transmembrane domain-containing protein [Pseudothauera rhizosphaerae]THF62647.1 flippase-like domain-containing protein [Pseudothauera rhizosphaerae]